jgi:hypothetical protein
MRSVWCTAPGCAGLFAYGGRHRPRAAAAPGTARAPETATLRRAGVAVVVHGLEPNAPSRVTRPSDSREPATVRACARFAHMLPCHRPATSYPGALRWVATRRRLDKPVSSSPPFSTGRATFTASGAAPEVLLHVEHGASVSISAAFTDVHPCLIPFHQPTLAIQRGNSLRVRWVLCSPRTFVLRTSPG